MFSIFSVKETSGKITLKHLFEIAKIKQQDPTLEWKSLQEICTMLLATARTCGIEVVKELDAKVQSIAKLFNDNFLTIIVSYVGQIMAV